MARTLPEAVVAAMNSETTDKAFFVLLKVTHSLFDTVYLVNNTENVTSNGNEYLAFPFSIVLPSDSEDLQPVIKVNVVNTTRELVSEIRLLAGNRERVKVTVSVIDYDDPDTVLAEWANFEMINVEYDAQSMTFDLVIDLLVTEPFPGDSFAPSTFPGIF